MFLKFFHKSIPYQGGENYYVPRKTQTYSPKESSLKSFIHVFNNYLLRPGYVPGTLLSLALYMVSILMSSRGDK